MRVRRAFRSRQASGRAEMRVRRAFRSRQASGRAEMRVERADAAFPRSGCSPAQVRRDRALRTRPACSPCGLRAPGSLTRGARPAATSALGCRVEQRSAARPDTAGLRPREGPDDPVRSRVAVARHGSAGQDIPCTVLVVRGSGLRGRCGARREGRQDAGIRDRAGRAGGSCCSRGDRGRLWRRTLSRRWRRCCHRGAFERDADAAGSLRPRSRFGPPGRRGAPALGGRGARSEASTPLAPRRPPWGAAASGQSPNDW